MTRLSVNINKVALLRNARGSNLPDLVKFAQDCEHFGAQGITVHPRPDERHIKYDDLEPLKNIVKTEFNIEGYPNERFLEMIQLIKPHQCTLVPDLPSALTSDNGWDTITMQNFLSKTVERIKRQGVRVSLFLNPVQDMVLAARNTGADRIEFYTGPYASQYAENREKAIESYRSASIVAAKVGIGINAGHDLNLENLRYFKEQIIGLQEVSIGQALISDALYFGISSTIQMYLHRLRD